MFKPSEPPKLSTVAEVQESASDREKMEINLKKVVEGTTLSGSTTAQASEVSPEKKTQNLTPKKRIVESGDSEEA